MKNLILTSFLFLISSSVFSGTCHLHRILLSEYGERATISDPAVVAGQDWERCFLAAVQQANMMNFDIFNEDKERFYLGLHWVYVGNSMGGKRKLQGEVNHYSHYLERNPVKGFAMLDVAGQLLSAGIPDDEEEKANGIDISELPRNWEQLFLRKK